MAIIAAASHWNAFWEASAVWCTEWVPDPWVTIPYGEMHGPTRGHRGTLAADLLRLAPGSLVCGICPMGLGRPTGLALVAWPRTIATPRGLGLRTLACTADGTLAAAITTAAINVRVMALDMISSSAVVSCRRTCGSVAPRITGSGLLIAAWSAARSALPESRASDV